MAMVCVSRSPSTPFGILDTPSHYQNTNYIRDFSSPRKSHVMKGVQNGLEGGSYGSAIITMPPQTARLRLHRDPAEGSSRTSSPSLSVDEESSKTDGSHGLQQSKDLEHGIILDPVFDADVESLIIRINDNVVIRDLAVKTPLWVQVPRGYLMEEAISPAAFYKSRQDVKTHLKKRKRTAGILPKKTRRGSLQEPHGFRPQEVNGTGAVSLEDCRPSNLTNDIHPLFDRSCFDDVPDAIYDQLLPGLQLATMFLTQPVCMQFWVTLAMGDRTVDPEMSEKNGKTSQRIERHIELTQQRAEAIIKRIKDLGESKLIHFRFRHKLFGTRTQTGAWGLSDPICDYRGIQKEAHGQKESLIRSIVRLHSDYYTVAKKLSQLKYLEVSQKLRFNFLFANLVMHELAHSIEGIHIQQRADQWVDWHTSRFYKEPYWLHWQSVEHASELGRAWEETVFGGEISPINNRVDGSHGIGTSDWPPRGSFDDDERRVWHTVSMDYIEGMFQMKTWQRVFDLKQWRFFNIPRDGATSLYLNYFTTMARDEEQRVANEVIADLMEIEIEQPAKKKRVTGSGEIEDHRLEGDEVIEQVVEEQAQQIEEPIGTKRQVPTIPGTPRLSSVTSSPHPNDASRLMLTPRTRKPSSISSRPSPRTKAMKLVGKTGYVSHELTPLQREFLQQQRIKDDGQRRKIEIATRALALNRANAKKSTFEVIKSIKTRPMGLMAKYRQREKTKIMDKRAEEQRKHETSANAASMIKEDLIRAWKNKQTGREEESKAAREKSTINSGENPQNVNREKEKNRQGKDMK